MTIGPRKFGEIRTRNGAPPTPGAIKKQTLRDAVTLLYGSGTINGRHVSNMPEADILALIRARRDMVTPASIDVIKRTPASEMFDPVTGELRAELIAEAAALMAEPPPREPASPDVVTRGNGKLATRDEAAVLDQLEDEAHRKAALIDAQAAFRDEP